MFKRIFRKIMKTRKLFRAIPNAIGPNSWAELPCDCRRATSSESRQAGRPLGETAELLLLVGSFRLIFRDPSRDRDFAVSRSLQFRPVRALLVEIPLLHRRPINTDDGVFVGLRPRHVEDVELVLLVDRLRRRAQGHVIPDRVGAEDHSRIAAAADARHGRVRPVHPRVVGGHRAERR